MSEAAELGMGHFNVFGRRGGPSYSTGVAPLVEALAVTEASGAQAHSQPSRDLGEL